MVAVAWASSDRGLATVPLRAQLSAKYTDTFAYPTIKDRCPVILCKVIDLLHRERNSLVRELGEAAREGLAKVLEQLSKLRYEMQTNKPLSPLEDCHPSSGAWNLYLAARLEEEGAVAWFSSSWMLVECYMYRRMAQAVNMAGPSLKGLDFFRGQKEEGFHSSLASMESLGSWLVAQLASSCTASQTWATLLQVSLWGNKCDLSISAGAKNSALGDPVTGLQAMAERILSNQGDEAWQRLEGRGAGALVDIVMDNSGFELFTDLCLADFMVTSGVASKVRLRIKNQPWFVSDTTPRDLAWSLERLAASNVSCLSQLGRRWSGHLEQGLWTVHDDAFWTLPHCYHEMAAVDPQLYSELSQVNWTLASGAAAFSPNTVIYSIFCWTGRNWEIWSQQFT